MLNLIAHTVRETEVSYLVQLDENDPLIVEFLEEYDYTIDDIKNNKIDFHSSVELWSRIIAIPADELTLDENIGGADERFVDFEAE